MGLTIGGSVNGAVNAAENNSTANQTIAQNGATITKELDTQKEHLTQEEFHTLYNEVQILKEELHKDIVDTTKVTGMLHHIKTLSPKLLKIAVTALSNPLLAAGIAINTFLNNEQEDSQSSTNSQSE